MASPTRHEPDSTPWQEWIAENVLLGADPRDIHKQMVAAGFSPEASEREVYAAMASPYIAAAKRVAGGTAAAPVRGGSSARAAKYAWWMEVQRRMDRLSSTHGIVPRLRRPSNEHFRDAFYAPNRPCLIEGAIDDWPALTRWTPDYLKATCGDAVVEVEGNRESADTGLLNVNRTMRFGDFVDLVAQGGASNDWYMTAQNDRGNVAALSALWDDVRLPDLLTQDQGPIGEAFLWYGPAGTLSSTHHDLTNNLMAQVIGRKRVLLVAPNESAHMYNDYNRASPVSLEEPDHERFPDLAEVTIMEALIGPGDLLFIPAGWWHSVRALDASFTFTFTNFVFEANDHYAYYASDEKLDD